MRGANITTAIAASLWFGWALLGRDLIDGVVAQRVPGAPNLQQIDWSIVWPLWVVIALLVAAWACNGLRRGSWALAATSATSIIILILFVIASGGGV